ncbi:LPXTG cell wall anchor domain-containing protein [Streptomyces sioyaensis]|uniref:LPXTG cell wall anchor domain-containing protein n=1 Tax=Streptomyces sioyaensis TaxID=67364 RepID=A0A4Q1QKE1_9ACTN|nr:LAETG motif-containing sortase-dependent surface protein [Streptomyces sioyaensis]MBM4794028.1 LPXTG cell wall anchor domain-containing protein [Streptomyces sioyaensis]RXS61204.1 LPXTG cell wall anchor domain-containing protein [Streptomyces sioyaensis]
MKLRRALTAAAATAVIAPAALMAAPAAFATTGPETAAGASAEPTPGTPATEQSGDTTTQPATPGAGDESAPGDTTGGDDATTGAETGGGTTPSAPATPGNGTKTGSPAKPSASAEPTEPGDDGDESDCTVDDAAIKVTVAHLPSKLVAGGGWKGFSVHLANTTDHTLDEVYPVIYAVPTEHMDHPTSQLDLEYQNPDTGKWTSFDEWTDGQYFGWFQLDGHQTAELKMRIRADKGATAGDGFALVAGDYQNKDGSCGWSKEQWYDFTILTAGSHPGTIPPAKPGKHGNKPGPQGGGKPVGTAKPKAGMDKLPVTGNLAETGASSALPTLALVGGVAMVVGAGAVFAVRRRRTDGGAAA